MVIAIMVLFIMMWGCATCITVMSPKSSGTRTATNTTNTISVSGTAAEGLDLQAVAELTKRVKNAEELERELNKPGGINNLDLDGNGETDFIKVTEYGDRARKEFGFSLTTEPAPGEVQEVADIQIAQQTEQVQVQVSGNQQIYGSGHHYSFFSSPATFLLMGYLLGNHSFYRPGWGYNSYPSYYSSYRTVPPSSYRSRTAPYTSGSTISRNTTPSMRTSAPNPNAGKVANTGIRRSLANPTATQRSFQTRSASRGTGSGGFGRNSGNVRNRSSSRSFGGRGK
jgi:hypothetical protein